MNVGILGGTFNPVHRGHLQMAQGALTALHLSQLLWIPAKLPPHKRVADQVSPEDRCRMVELAIAGNPAFALSRIELDRDGPSYTVETLRQLTQESARRHGGQTDWYLLLGSDLLPELSSWRAIEEAKSLATFVVVPRPNTPIAALPPGLRRLEIPTLDLSSSEVRRRARAGQPIDELVPAPVARYIADHHLYA